MKRLFLYGFVLLAAMAAASYHTIGKIKIGGSGGWDYLSVDNAARRIYVSNGDRVVVVDPDAGKMVGEIPNTPGVHGIALAPDLNKGFISEGRANDIAIFDLKTLQKTGSAKTGTNPDSICYEPKTARVFAFNGRSNDATAIDAKTGAVVGTFPVGSKPEFCVVDGSGKLYVNIENTA